MGTLCKNYSWRGHILPNGERRLNHCGDSRDDGPRLSDDHRNLVTDSDGVGSDDDTDHASPPIAHRLHTDCTPNWHIVRLADTFIPTGRTANDRWLPKQDVTFAQFSTVGTVSGVPRARSNERRTKATTPSSVRVARHQQCSSGSLVGRTTSVAGRASSVASRRPATLDSELSSNGLSRLSVPFGKPLYFRTNA
jgi:hypothetical protein